MKQDLAFIPSQKLKVMETVLLLSKAFAVMGKKEVKVYFERCRIKWLMCEVKGFSFVL